MKGGADAPPNMSFLIFFAPYKIASMKGGADAPPNPMYGISLDRRTTASMKGGADAPPNSASRPAPGPKTQMLQ